MGKAYRAARGERGLGNARKVKSIITLRIILYFCNIFILGDKTGQMGL